MSPSLQRRLCHMLLGFGAVLFIMTLFIDKIGLAEGTNRVRLMLGLLSAFCIFGGALGRRFVSFYQGMAVMGLNAVVMLICLELSATVYHHITRPAPARDLSHAFLPHDENAATILQEVRNATFDPELYVGWMNRPYRGKTLTIRQDGLRHTPGAICDANAFHVFTFGGSTMWGESAPDARTIPAYLQQLLASDLGRPLCVTNYGQRAWVSTQSLVKLVIELQRGHVPDVVVFYDGYNDVFAGYATGRVGVPENFLQLAEFKQQCRAGKRALIRMAKKTQLGKFIQRLVAESPKATRTIDASRLSKDIVSTYQQVLQIAGALAHEYGFVYAFFWQPQLAAGTKPLSHDERAILDHHPWLPQSVRELTDAVYARIDTLARMREDLIDLSDAFADVPDRVYIDPAHITSTGNHIVAQAMLDAGLRQLVVAKAADSINSKMSP